MHFPFTDIFGIKSVKYYRARKSTSLKATEVRLRMATIHICLYSTHTLEHEISPSRHVYAWLQYTIIILHTYLGTPHLCFKACIRMATSPSRHVYAWLRYTYAYTPHIAWNTPPHLQGIYTHGYSMRQWW